MPKKIGLFGVSMIVGTLLSHVAFAQTGRTAAGAEGKTAETSESTDRLKVLRAAADALGMIRWSDIGAGPTRLPGIDVLNTMEIFASGTVYTNGQAYEAEYHAAAGYVPTAMRVEITRKGATGDVAHTIQTVRENYAWNESEIGAGLIPGKGAATPALPAVKARLLQLWILPYGVVKAAIAAGDKTQISKQNGMTSLTFPLSGPLAGITVTATLDSKNLVTHVETKPDNPALANLAREVEYSDYADHGDILTDIKSPAHIVEKEAGKPLFDLRIKMVNANNPYLVFPVPQNVKAASSTQTSASANGTN